jgi:tripartite-type tricarboxylate transporter receptor subunit TctC
MKALLLALLMSATAALAQPITLVTTSGAGSNQDTVARAFAPLLAKETGREVIVVNVAGADGLLGLRHFARLPTDGNALLVGGLAIAYNLALRPATDTQELTGFEPVHGLAESRMSVVVAADAPVTDVAGLKQWAASKNGLTAANPAPASSLMVAELDEQLGTRTTLVPYSQTGQGLLDVAAGRVDFTVSVPGNAATAGLISSGRLRVLPGVEVESSRVWSAIFSHAGGTPWGAAVARVVGSSEFESVLAAKSPGSAPFKTTTAFVTKQVARERRMLTTLQASAAASTAAKN